MTSDLEGGRTEALARVESARKGTAEEVAKILEVGSRQAESVKRQIVGAAELDARNAQLRALEKAVNEVFDSAVKEISRLSGEDAEESLVRLMAEGLEIIGPRARVHCAAKDRKAVAAAVKKAGTQSKLTMEEEPIETIGGVVLSTPDGSVRFDNTFEARLERMRPTLRKDVAEILTSSS